MKKWVPVKEFDWASNGLEHQYLTCKNHSTARYLTKHPRMRGLHFIRRADEALRGEGEWTDMGECKCPYEDLVVLVDNEEKS